MDSYSLKGKVIKVYDLQQKTENFRKREFVVEVNSSNDRGTFVEPIKLQAVQSNCDLLSHVHKGDLVVVKWALMGRKWGKSPDEAYFTNVEALDVTVVSKAEGSQADDAIEEQFPLGEREEGSNQFPGPIDDGDNDIPF